MVSRGAETGAMGEKACVRWTPLVRGGGLHWLPSFYREITVTAPSTTDPSDRQAYAIALIGGASLWLLTSLISGRAEAWDAPMYWSVTYPLAILLAGALGYRVPVRAWRWGLVVMLVQATVMLLTSGSSMTLLPLGLALFAVLALPAIAAATFAARLRAWRSDRA